MEYFIIDNNGQQAGPFSLDQLVQKGITPETLVWKQGMADWTPAWKVDDMKAVLEAVEADKQNQATLAGKALDSTQTEATQDFIITTERFLPTSPSSPNKRLISLLQRIIRRRDISP